MTSGYKSKRRIYTEALSYIVDICDWLVFFGKLTHWFIERHDDSNKFKKGWIEELKVKQRKCLLCYKYIAFVNCNNRTVPNKVNRWMKMKWRTGYCFQILWFRFYCCDVMTYSSRILRYVPVIVHLWLHTTRMPEKYVARSKLLVRIVSHNVARICALI